jgi:hypothetical protein
VLAGHGQAMLRPFAIALVIMGIVAALGGAAAWFGVAGSSRSSAGPATAP